MGPKAVVTSTLEELVNQVCTHAQKGDQILCMSNGSFGGIHEKILAGLKQKFLA
jgi:UDP-N-acetylmuramate: L-alanyl-gamma-D-glutamyl-meso-diaminopimelate ligase